MEIKEESVNQFRDNLKEISLSLSKKQLEQFLLYYSLLVEKNKVMNLTAITEFQDVAVKHFVDSLCLVKVIPALSNQKVLDMGTGAGFPGIPLKIMFPDLNITLMDSLNKRVNFLKEVISKLELTKITAVHGRAEELAKQKNYRQQYDICVSRAVSNLRVLSEYCIPFVKCGGLFISYKAFEIEEELENAGNAIKKLGGETGQVVKFRLPESDIGRSLVCVNKIKDTPGIYPRKAGTPQKNPI